MSHNAWFEHFKEQLQGLTEAYGLSGSNLSLLGYALQEKRLSSEEYLSWAVTHYQLPQLQNRFFTETPLSQEMFAKWATHYRWSVECLPVAEWDGSLIVACLEPPQDFPSFPTAVLVLANSELLAKAWADFHPKAVANANLIQAASASPSTSEMPEGIDLTSATKTISQPSDSFSFEDLGMSESANAERDFSETSAGDIILETSSGDEALAGLFDSPTVVTLHSLGPITAVSAKPVEEPTSEAVVVEEKTSPVLQAPLDTPSAEGTISAEIPAATAPVTAGPIVTTSAPITPPPPARPFAAANSVGNSSSSGLNAAPPPPPQKTQAFLKKVLAEDLCRSLHALRVWQSPR